MVEKYRKKPAMSEKYRNDEREALDRALEPTDAMVQVVRETVFAQSQRERRTPGSVYYPSIEAATVIARAALRAALTTKERQGRGWEPGDPCNACGSTDTYWNQQNRSE